MGRWTQDCSNLPIASVVTMGIRRQNRNAFSLLQILFCTRRHLLACAGLKSKCALSARARTTCAIACVGAFFGMIAIVLGFRAVPLEWVPVLFGGAFALFLISTLLAYRFGRLCNAEIGHRGRTRSPISAQPALSQNPTIRTCWPSDAHSPVSTSTKCGAFPEAAHIRPPRRCACPLWK